MEIILGPSTDRLSSRGCAAPDCLFIYVLTSAIPMAFTTFSSESGGVASIIRTTIHVQQQVRPTVPHCCSFVGMHAVVRGCHYHCHRRCHRYPCWLILKEKEKNDSIHVKETYADARRLSLSLCLSATYSPRRLLTWSTFMVQIDCPLPFVDVSYCAHGAAASIAAAIWFRISILRLLQPAVGSWLPTGAQTQKQQFYIIDLMYIFRFHLSAALQCITTPPCFVSAPSCAERQP